MHDLKYINSVDIDITGLTFGKLHVLKQIEGTKRWLCECKCKNKCQVYQSHLIKGEIICCGCSTITNNKNSCKHGLSKTRLYGIWKGMVRRCYNEKCDHYCDYGGRGIKICDEWVEDEGLIRFFVWALTNDYADNLSIDRINVNGNYEPGNCRWATYKEQANNTRVQKYGKRNKNNKIKRNTMLIEINGEEKTVLEWSKITGTPERTIRGRIKRGLKGIEIIQRKPKETELSNRKYIYWNKRVSKWIILVHTTEGRVSLGYHTELDQAKKVRDDFMKNHDNTKYINIKK